MTLEICPCTFFFFFFFSSSFIVICVSSKLLRFLHGHHLTFYQVYDEAQNRWTTVREMNLPRVAFGTIVHDGAIWVVGGADVHDVPVANMEKFDPVTEQVSRAASSTSSLKFFR